MPPSKSFSTTLLELGAISSIDITKLSNSTLTGMVSHIRTLKRNKIPLEKNALTSNTIKMLNSLIDKHGNPLNDLYKRQIGMTLRRLFPDSDIDLRIYNKSRTGTHRHTRLSSNEFISDIKSMITGASNIINTIYTFKKIDDLGLYDTCVMILITCSTSLRAHETAQLKIYHIDKIKNMEPINIKSKSSRNTRNIAPNSILLSVFSAVTKQRAYVEKYLRDKTQDSNTRGQRERFVQDFIVTSSEDYMRKKLHELAASLGISKRVLGFNIFRKYLTTLLIEGGGHFTAQAMNNHSDLNTTLDHYNVITSKGVEDTYANIQNLMNQLIKTPEESKAHIVKPEILDSKLFGPDTIKKEIL